jgi:hypothetical protein
MIMTSENLRDAAELRTNDSVSSDRSTAVEPEALTARERLQMRASWSALVIAGVCAVVLRFYGIAHLPGINGDEPQYAVHAQSWLSGAPLRSLRTGSDLPMNPLFFGPVVLLQWFCPATLTTLRLAAVVQSLFAVVLAFALFRGRGRMFVATFALAVAVLPEHLGYARFAWDPTAVPTAAVLALAAAVRLRVVWTALAFGLCLWVHPTSIFLLPVLLGPFVWTYWPRDEAGRVRSIERRPLIVGLLVLLAAGITLVLLISTNALPVAVLSSLRPDLISAALQRLLAPIDFLRFIVAYVKLLSGVTIYEYVPGSVSSLAANCHVALALLLVVALGVAALRLRRAEFQRVDVGAAFGLGAALVLEYLIAGPTALAPKTERYGICLTVPACYLVAVVLSALAASSAKSATVLRWITALAAGALLTSFGANYLDALHRPDAQREDTFRTGPIDPKQLALEAVLRMRHPEHIAVVYVEDWWIYWTLRYLAPPGRGVRVTIQDKPWNFRFPRDFVLPKYDPATMELFGIAWAGRGLDRKYAAQSIASADVMGYESGPILRVYQLRSELKRAKRARRP